MHFTFLSLLLMFVSATVIGQSAASKEGYKIDVVVNLPGRSDTAITSGGPDSFGSAYHWVSQSPKKSGNSDEPRPANGKRNSNKSDNGVIDITLVATQTTCSYADGSIIVSATGGVSPYTYTYKIGSYEVTQNNGVFTSLYAGSYEITVTDADGNTTSTNYDVTSLYDGPTVAFPTFTYPSSGLASDGSITLSATGGLPPYTYSLDFVNYQPDPTFSGLPPGLYVGYVKDANGCIRSATGIFLNGTNARFGKGLSGSGVICGKKAFFDISIASDGTPPFEYSVDGLNFQSSGHFENLDAGLTRFYFRDATGRTESYTVNIFSYCPLELSATTTDASCGKADGAITISAGYGKAPYSYTLDGINYQSSPVFNGLEPGYYTYIAKDADGIRHSYQVEITTNCPIVTAVSSPETCGLRNGTITATAVRGENVQFSIDGVNFQTGGLFSNLTAGDYIVTIRDKSGATSTTSVTVKSDCFQIVSIAVQGEHCGQADGSVSTIVSGGSVPYQFSLDGINFQFTGDFNRLPSGTYTLTVMVAAGGTVQKPFVIPAISGPSIKSDVIPADCQSKNGSIEATGTGGSASLLYSINGSNFSDISAFNNLDTGDYVVVVKDAYGCSASDTIALKSVPTPFVALGNDTVICKGKTIVLTAQENPDWSYEWNDKSTLPQLSVMVEGTYSVTVRNKYGCVASDTVRVVDRTVPAFTLGADTTVCGNLFSIQLKPYPAVDGAYEWSTGSDEKSIMVTIPGNYQLLVDHFGCKASAVRTIVEQQQPTVFLGRDTTLCSGAQILLNAAFPGAAYTWQDGSGQSTFVASASGRYSVSVELNGCMAMDTILVNFVPMPFFAFGKDTSLCEGQQLELAPRVNTGVSFLWQDGSTQPFFFVKKPGRYSLTVKNGCGSFSRGVTINPENNCGLFIPNAFTPNDDGLNDVFKVVYPIPVTSFRLTVYNRFGQKIFETNDIRNGWDGRYKGEPQPLGVYVWTLEVTVPGKVPNALKGTVTLLK